MGKTCTCHVSLSHPWMTATPSHYYPLSSTQWQDCMTSPLPPPLTSQMSDDDLPENGNTHWSAADALYRSPSGLDPRGQTCHSRWGAACMSLHGTESRSLTSHLDTSLIIKTFTSFWPLDTGLWRHCSRLNVFHTPAMLSWRLYHTQKLPPFP